MSDDDETPDLLALFDELQPMIELLRGVVAKFISEGYTESQARELSVVVLKNSQASA